MNRIKLKLKFNFRFLHLVNFSDYIFIFGVSAGTNNFSDYRFKFGVFAGTNKVWGPT